MLLPSSRIYPYRKAFEQIISDRKSLSRSVRHRSDEFQRHVLGPEESMTEVADGIGTSFSPSLSSCRHIESKGHFRALYMLWVVHNLGRFHGLRPRSIQGSPSSLCVELIVNIGPFSLRAPDYPNCISRWASIS
jgi:hypothetical protein